jgi:hypothetical protein
MGVHKSPSLLLPLLPQPTARVWSFRSVEHFSPLVQPAFENGSHGPYEVAPSFLPFGPEVSLPFATEPVSLVPPSGPGPTPTFALAHPKT